MPEAVGDISRATPARKSHDGAAKVCFEMYGTDGKAWLVLA